MWAVNHASVTEPQQNCWVPRLRCAFLVALSHVHHHTAWQGEASTVCTSPLQEGSQELCSRSSPVPLPYAPLTFADFSQYLSVVINHNWEHNVFFLSSGSPCSKQEGGLGDS